MDKYKCEICSKNHSFYFGSKGALPLYMVQELMDNPETKRIFKLADELFVVDNEKLIIQGIITIETDFVPEQIYHTIWVEIPFNKYFI